MGSEPQGVTWDHFKHPNLLGHFMVAQRAQRLDTSMPLFGFHALASCGWVYVSQARGGLSKMSLFLFSIQPAESQWLQLAPGAGAMLAGGAGSACQAGEG